MSKKIYKQYKKIYYKYYIHIIIQFEYKNFINAIFVYIKKSNQSILLNIYIHFIFNIKSL